MTRSLGVLTLLLLGCGKGDDRKAPPVEVIHDAAPPIDAAGAPPLGALDGRIPRLTGDAVMPLAPPPVAVVLIDKTGTVRVALSGGSWATVTAAGFGEDGLDVTALEDLPGALLTVLERGGEPGGAAAKLMREELAAEAANPDADADAGADDSGWGYGYGTGISGTTWGGEQEVSVTYAAEPGAALPIATPLLIVHPGAPGGFVADVVDRVGGALAVAHGTTVRVFRLGFPWEHASYGGATLPGDDEAPSVDVFVDGAELVIGGDGADTSKLATSPLDAAALTAAVERHASAATVPALPPTTIDVIIPSAIEAQAALDIVAAIDGGTTRRIGVASSPWGLLGDTSTWGTIGTGRYGTVAGPDSATGEGTGYTGRRVGPGPLVRLGLPVVVGELDKAIIRRYLKRNQPKVAYCYEKQLLASPKLTGTVNVKLVITEAGLVATASATGVSPEVSSCVAGVVKAIEFPKPKQGIAQVTVSIVFKPTGG